VVLKEISEKFGGRAELGIHTHNDLGMAVANAIEAAKVGCLYADVTVGGIGERAGNCDLAQLVCASSSIFDWGVSDVDARRLEEVYDTTIK
jgi:homocitrate synthase NifV